MVQAMLANLEGGLALFVSALQGSLAAGSAVGGIIYDTEGPGGALIVAAVFAALGALTLLGRLRGHQRRAGAVKTVPADRTTARSTPAGEADSGAVARRDRWSREQRPATMLKLPSAALPRPLPGRNCHAQRDCDDRVRAA